MPRPSGCSVLEKSVEPPLEGTRLLPRMQVPQPGRQGRVLGRRAAQGLGSHVAKNLTLSLSTRRYRNQDGEAVYSDTALFVRNMAACPNKLKPRFTPPSGLSSLLNG